MAIQIPDYVKSAPGYGTLWSVPNYPNTRTQQPAGSAPKPTPTLPSLTAEQLAVFNQRRRGADEGLQTALANAAASKGRAETSLQSALARITQQFAGARDKMMADFGDRGLAFQPRFAGKGTRALAEGETQARGDARNVTADRLAAIEAMVAEARRQRDQELASIEADRVRQRADLARLLQSIGA